MICYPEPAHPINRKETERAFYYFHPSCMFDPMADLADTSATSEDPLAPAPYSSAPSAPRTSAPRGGGFSRGGGDGGSYADEIHSVRINARQRTFYLDLKQSSQGKFFKLSEKSRGGRKVTIMFDVEDLPKFLSAFTEMQGKI